MSMSAWEFVGESSVKAENALIKEFPTCTEVISDSMACVRALHSQGIYTKELENRLCKERKAKASWCILATFCPAEAAAFMKCNKNKIPGVKSDRVDLFCGDAWKKFDDCLINLTNANEADPNFGAIPNSQTQPPPCKHRPPPPPPASSS